jgi:hypothetical protein
LRDCVETEGKAVIPAKAGIQVFGIVVVSDSLDARPATILGTGPASASITKYDTVSDEGGKGRTEIFAFAGHASIMKKSTEK